MSKRKPLDNKDDMEFFHRTHARWMKKRNRRQDDSNYRDEWRQSQCFSCSYFLPLTGVFCGDYGGCANERSPFDGFVRFEHDGCEFHEWSDYYRALEEEEN